ncbi:hypothetical protein [Okeania sp.]|uniref:hypothetical protein n=1 Tax=Okeania sp. TaxID=3100323 RepID=UPI002B4B2817|nr:hypothetical protein [Okeania sp.]MEB3343123.1 hypothetical protein [Okeania sp.]
MNIPIKLPDSCNFSDYFKFNYYLEDIVNYFGYQLIIEELVLPKSEKQFDGLENLKQRFRKSLPFITLDSEMARREFLIAPVLIELVDYCQAKLKVSYALEIEPQLKGSLDYFLEAGNNLLVIEAKKENLERGFKQLAVELIALDKGIESEQNLLYGAVSIGKIWQFAVLKRQEKELKQDLNLYQVPNDLEDLMKILVAILTNE